LFKGDIMTSKDHIDSHKTDGDIIETTIHCLNTRRKYIYLLKNGQIISERIVPVTD
jgi:hypothetical protein